LQRGLAAGSTKQRDVDRDVFQFEATITTLEGAKGELTKEACADWLRLHAHKKQVK